MTGSEKSWELGGKGKGDVRDDFPVFVQHLLDGSAFSEEEPLRGGRILVGTFWVLRL